MQLTNEAFFTILNMVTVICLIPYWCKLYKDHKQVNEIEQTMKQSSVLIEKALMLSRRGKESEARALYQHIKEVDEYCDAKLKKLNDK